MGFTLEEWYVTNDYEDFILEESSFSQTSLYSIFNENFKIENRLVFNEAFKATVKSKSKKLEENNKNIIKILEKNIKGFDKEKHVTKVANKIKNICVKGGATAAQMIMRDIEAAINIIKNLFYVSTFQFSKVDEKLLVCLVILYIVVLINTAMLQLFIPIFGISKSYTILGIIVAPITEEIGKMLSVKLGAAHEYNIFFNTGEFLSYFKSLRMFGASTSYILKARIPAIIMHTFNTYCIEKVDEKTKGKKTLLATQCTMLIHCLFNSLGAKLISKYLLQG